MTSAQTDAPATIISLTCEQRVYPPYDHLHGTPHAMLQRKVTIVTNKGKAAFEQSDYGHPGKLNPWYPRGIDSPLQPRLNELRAMAEAAGAFLDRS